MVSAYRAQFDYIVLKPIWFLLLCRACMNFYAGAWGTGLIYVVMLFAMGYVGAGLHRTLLFTNPDAGTSSLAAATVPSAPGELSSDDSRAVASASIRVTFLVGVAIAVAASHAHGLLFCVLLGVVTWWLGIPVIVLLFNFVARQYMLGRLRALAPGLMLFWLGVLALVVPLIFLARSLSA